MIYARFRNDKLPRTFTVTVPTVGIAVYFNTLDQIGIIRDRSKWGSTDRFGRPLTFSKHFDRRRGLFLLWVASCSPFFLPLFSPRMKRGVGGGLFLSAKMSLYFWGRRVGREKEEKGDIIWRSQVGKSTIVTTSIRRRNPIWAENGDFLRLGFVDPLPKPHARGEITLTKRGGFPLLLLLLPFAGKEDFYLR